MAASAGALALFLTNSGVAEAAVDPGAPNARFIKVSTSGAPTWKASADLYKVDKNGTKEIIYHWHESHIAGNHALWRYYGSPDAMLKVYVEGLNSREEDIVAYHNVCFKIDPLGFVSGAKFSDGNGEGQGKCTTR